MCIRDRPTSVPELYDFAANWVWDYGEDHPEISLFDLGSYSNQILNSSSHHILYCSLLW